MWHRGFQIIFKELGENIGIYPYASALSAGHIHACRTASEIKIDGDRVKSPSKPGFCLTQKIGHGQNNLLPLTFTNWRYDIQDTFLIINNIL